MRRLDGPASAGLFPYFHLTLISIKYVSYNARITFRNLRAFLCPQDLHSPGSRQGNGSARGGEGRGWGNS